MASYKTCLIALAALLAPQALANSQVNFYWDAHCQSYAGSAEVDLNADVVGGPAGAQSMLWVNYDDSCYDTCGPNHLFCKNAECSAWDVSDDTGECKHFANGIWAAQLCGCLGCSQECTGSP